MYGALLGTNNVSPFRRTQQAWSDSRVVKMLKKKKTEFTSGMRNDLVSGDERCTPLVLAAATNAHVAFPWPDTAEPPTELNPPLPSLPAVEDVLRQAGHRVGAEARHESGRDQGGV
jgi:hypothetical protein